jgi:GPH family glycoside/pentoside/hexuronide:cation symporter
MENNNTQSSMIAGDVKISLKEKFCYAIGDPACNVVFALTTTLLTFFYTDYIGISAGTVGMIMLLSRVFDGGSDVIMGLLTDRTHSRHGKARPWILWMTIPYGVSAVAMFMIPAGATDMFKTVYIFVTYNLVQTVVYTALTLPYGTLASLMTRSQHERELINIMRMGVSPFGRILTTACTLPLVKLLGNDQRAWIISTMIFACVAMAMLFTCFFATKERVKVDTEQKKIPVKDSLKALFSNKYWAISMALWGMLSVYSTLIGTDLTYYCKYILGNDLFMSPIYTAEQAPMVIVIFLMPLGLKKFGKRNMALAGSILVILGQLIFFINPLSFQVAMASAIVKGIGQAPLYGAIFSFIADSIEFGQWKTHLRIEGMIYSAASVGSKIGAGLTSAILGQILDKAGYNGLLETQSASAISAISGIFKFGPIIVWGMTAILLALWKLEKQYPSIMKELAERESRGEI